MTRPQVIVTGGAGFVGSNLVRLLLSETKYDVIVIDKLTYAGNLDSLADVLNNDRLTFHEADICDASTVQKIFAENQTTDQETGGICGVLHLAAESHVDRSIEGPAPFIQTNLVGTFTMLEAARQYVETKPQQGFRLVHVSTDEVYGSLAADAPPFTEATAYNPRSPYSASKAGSDHLAQAWHETYGLPVIVTHGSNNYGPHQFTDKLIPVVITKAIGDEPIPVYGDGQNIRDWIYVEDHARAIVAALEHGQPGQTYNIGGNNEQRNIDLVRQICKMLDEKTPRDDGQSYQEQITFVADRPGHDFRYAIDNTKVKNELDFELRESFTTGLSKTIDWYLEKAVSIEKREASCELRAARKHLTPVNSSALQVSSCKTSHTPPAQ